ncbi:hypothetical protein [Devosia sp. Root635]|uniref:hypothetical protein n=1 Tax=Devosia sp. Root635 TaxID=1736575 RepID=UPI0006FF422C|nr:hypothetical protein [Devosia sp. Root635]KRA40274.1 hypothetical protein ASD80_12775 [Devosia sp. Root635]
MIYGLAILIGVVAGLRAITPIAALAIGGALGWIYLEGTTFAFLLSPIALWLFIAIAIGEIVNDKLARTPSRKVPMQFGVRILAGMFAGAVLAVVPTGETVTALIIGAIAGAVGAVVGTLVGATLRTELARTFRADMPAALVEDAIAIVAALAIVYLA